MLSQCTFSNFRATETFFFFVREENRTYLVDPIKRGRIGFRKMVYRLLTCVLLASLVSQPTAALEIVDDYYKQLGVSRDATDPQVSSASAPGSGLVPVCVQRVPFSFSARVPQTFVYQRLCGKVYRLWIGVVVERCQFLRVHSSNRSPTSERSNLDKGSHSSTSQWWKISVS
jgi:hypothetical protein